MVERRKTTQRFRYDFEKTAVGRLAAIAEDVEIECLRRHGHAACFADFRDGMRDFVEIELLIARQLEAGEIGNMKRVADLQHKIDALK